MDQPDLNDEQAEEKLSLIAEEKSERMKSMMVEPEKNPMDQNNEDNVKDGGSNEDQGDEVRDISGD
jgi:hypothetical protein